MTEIQIMLTAFTVAMATLFKLAKKPVSAQLSKEKELIISEIKESENLLAEAKKLLKLAKKELNECEANEVKMVGMAHNSTEEQIKENRQVLQSRTEIMKNKIAKVHQAKEDDEYNKIMASIADQAIAATKEAIIKSNKQVCPEDLKANLEAIL